ncbi:GNAT family N-acetyltransferase [Actinopolymorpha rutila]|uniref:Ribosomal protein S18 acetylase RimI-like enzyme n=1 Tax=Actinopolymorpha rutila TaxID=446787 RepID=A0A852ZPC7_9ACTN|nr:GNAT family N-acetyltransferase [Actinopolymorpha rutila]NYH91329.1 ribosomal protein S18 acetylase RimI-like enzyme [Actinopolymorpha rutila]
MGDVSVEYEHRARLEEAELQGLFEVAWGARKCDFGRVLARSFTWVTARIRSQLVGFVNVAWDGGAHFFLLDTTVHPDWQHQGIGVRLVQEAIADCRGHGEWLHVDSDETLMASFYRRCGFEPVPAGAINVGRVNG